MHISAIFIYPIKGLPGISVETSMIQTKGLQFDRRWMLVDENNQFLSQRELPILSQCKVQMHKTGFLIYSPNGLSAIEIPFQICGPEQLVKVWNDSCIAHFLDKEVDEWFSKIIDRTCRLVFMPEHSQRLLIETNVPANSSVSFADGFPILLIGSASLQFLNNQLQEPVLMDRFRPNIVISGSAPFAEDQWGDFKIKENRFKAIKPCARCSVTSINQQTGEPGTEPLRTLSLFRKKGAKIFFGENIICTHIASEICVGDLLQIETYKEFRI